MPAAIRRYFQLREIGREMKLRFRWYWSNERCLKALFEERIRREIARKSWTKRAAILDFRGMN